MKAVILGDSLSVGTSPFLRKTFTDWTWDEFSKVGLSMDQGMDEAQKLPLASADIIFVSLGTNNWYTQYERFVWCVNHIRYLAMKGPTIIWGTIVRPTRDVLDGYLKWNNYLRTRRDPNFGVADWRALVDQHPEYVAQDSLHIHPDSTGYQMRARLYADQVRKFKVTHM